MKKIQEYIKLARLDKPAGSLLLMWPCWYGVLLVASVESLEFSKVINSLILFFIGAFSMRSSGCIINDIWDRKIDAQVERTKSRPLACGSVSIIEAVILLGLFLLAGLWVFLNLTNDAKIIAIIGFMMAVIYPSMKRITKYPQAFLGATFNIGVLVSFTELRVESLEFSDFYPIILLYTGLIFWTLAYDTIYAHQDKNDDAKIGVKSTALTFSKNPKLTIFVFFTLCYLLISLSFVLTPKPYLLKPFLFMLPAYLHMIWQVKAADLDSPKDCMAKFKSNAYTTGVLMFVGMAFLQLNY